MQLKGPVIENTLNSAADVDNLPSSDINEAHHTCFKNDGLRMDKFH